MQYDILEDKLVLECPEDQLDYIFALMGLDDMDKSDRFCDELDSEEEHHMAQNGVNRDMAMEFFPKRVSQEATECVLEALGLTAGDFPDAEIE
jgi:hypothetical protein